MVGITGSGRDRGNEREKKRRKGGRNGVHTRCLPAAAVQLESYPQAQLSHFQNFHQSIKSVVWKINNIDLNRNCLMNSIIVGNRKIKKYYYFMTNSF